MPSCRARLSRVSVQHEASVCAGGYGKASGEANVVVEVLDSAHLGSSVRNMVVPFCSAAPRYILTVALYVSGLPGASPTTKDDHHIPHVGLKLSAEDRS